ncbi:MAG: hypothetical protein ACT4OI_07650 [Methanobacteriota archaeon]
MERRLVFAYGRALAYGRLVVFIVLIVLVAVVMGASPPAAPELLTVSGVVLAAVLLVFGVSPLSTRHWLTRSRVILRQGWYFRAAVPFRDIQSIESAEDLAPHRVPLGIHRPLGRPTLFVTGGRTGLVRVVLARPRRFLQAFGLPASEIVFDVARPKEFLEALRERRALFAPVEADRADA